MWKSLIMYFPRFVSIFAFLFFITITNAQQHIIPDYDAIELAVENQNSPYFYPQLLEKYNSGDPNMSIQEKMHVYFGFVFHTNYNPAKEQQSYLDFLNLLHKSEQNNTTVNELISAINITLDENPIHIMALNQKLHLLKRASMSEEYEITLQKLNVIYDAIKVTGSGFMEDFPYHIIDPKHKFSFLPDIGFNFNGGQTIMGEIEAVAILTPNTEDEKIYFNRKPYYDFTTN